MTEPDLALRNFVREELGRSDLAVLVRQLQSQPRVVSGVIDTTGPTVLSGTGFSVSRLGVGRVRVTFDQAYATQPAVGTSAEGATTNMDCRIYTHNAGVSVDLQVWNTDTGAVADGACHFMVRG